MKTIKFRSALAILAITPSLHPQTASGPSFAVVSIKPDRSTEPRAIGWQFLPGGRFRAENLPLIMLIAAAYNVPFQSSRLSGGPDWIHGERFDIEATAENGAIPAGATADEREQKMRVMLQTLLAQRFHLKMRRETKDQPVYAVVVAKGGPKLKAAEIEEEGCGASKDIDCHNFHGGRGRGLHAKAANIADLALFVSNWTDRPLVDKTGLKGLFQFETRGWTNMAPGPTPAPGALAEDGQDAASIPTIFTVFADLGLKLDAQRAPVESFVIESVERPSGN